MNKYEVFTTWKAIIKLTQFLYLIIRTAKVLSIFKKAWKDLQY
jgi:hypothetical protein